MKKIIGYLIVAAASFTGGAFLGYYVRKKSAEAAFEEISEEEQAEQYLADQEEKIQRPVDIQAAINRTFGLPDNYTAESDIPHEESNLVQINTQKIQYMNRRKAEEAADKYDTRTKEDPRNPVVSDEEEDPEKDIDPEFIKVCSGVEEATADDWDHWIGIQDGDYDCVEMWWYEAENVLTDEKDRRIKNPAGYLGFSVPNIFREPAAGINADPDVRDMYNHDEGVIFQIVRKHESFGRQEVPEEMEEDEDDDREDDYDRIHSRLT